MKKAAAYCMTRNLYNAAVPSIKSLLVNSDVDVVYLIIEDDEFPVKLPRTKVINVSNQEFFRPDGPNMSSRYTYMAMMRAALCKILKEHRVLSLDYDTIIDGDISELWTLPLGKNYLAAGLEPHKTTSDFQAINAGVVLFNLKQMRDGKADQIIEALNCQPYAFLDQDAINEFCQGGILPLDPKYNQHTWSYPTDEKPVIVHYAGYEEAIWSRFELPRKYASIEVTK